MMKFSLKIALLTPLIGFVMVLNYRMDPAHLFQGDKYEMGIADLLLAGHNVANVSNYNDRLVQKFYIEGLNKNKDILVFGSSHAMVIHAELFPGKTMFNNSVSGASLEDFVAISEMYHQRGLLPSIVIISLDPWLLNRNNCQTQCTTLQPEYAAAVRRLGLPFNPAPENQIPSTWNKYKELTSSTWNIYQELISPSYFQESFRIWLLTLDGNKRAPGSYYPTEEMIGDVPIRLADDSLSYPADYRARFPPYVNLDNATTTLQGFTRLDPELTRIMETWVADLQKDGVQVIFLLTPYHPSAYNFLVDSPNYHIIVDVQKYYEDLALRKGIQLIGSYNPDDIPCSGNEFYDEQHPRESCIEKIWAKHQ
jgi:hypothetical protein